jgi:putative endonuclease
MDNWSVYMIRCSDGSLYTGVTKDLNRRMDEHNNDNQLGSRYTRVRRPVFLVYQEGCVTRSVACKREFAIKQLSKQEKEVLVGKELE